MMGCKKTNMLTKAIKKAGGGKVQTSSDTARKLAKEMGGMKKGGAAKMPREGVSSRPTGPGGRPLTMKDLEKANRDTGGMSAAEIKAAGEAIKRANRVPYEPIPKKAMGGMLNKVAQAKQGAVKPSGGMLGKVVQAAAKQGAEKAIGGMLGNLAQSTAKPIGKVVKAVANRAAAQPIGKLTQSAPQPTAKPSGGMFSKLAQAASKPAAPQPIGKIVSNPAATQRLPTPVPVAKAPADRALARQEKPEMKPVRRAKGGAGKVRKGMMSKSGDILQAVKPKKGIGGIM